MHAAELLVSKDWFIMKCKRLFIIYCLVILTIAVCYNISVSYFVDDVMLATRASTLYEITVFYEKDQWLNEFGISLRRHQRQSELFTDIFGCIFLIIGVVGFILSYFFVDSNDIKKGGKVAKDVRGE